MDYTTDIVPSKETKTVEEGMEKEPMSDEHEESETSTPQQKRFKYALLMALVLIIIYVIIDYTVRARFIFVVATEPRE